MICVRTATACYLWWYVVGVGDTGDPQRARVYVLMAGNVCVLWGQGGGEGRVERWLEVGWQHCWCGIAIGALHCCSVRVVIGGLSVVVI